MTTETRVLLLRHGQSTWNAEGRWQGWADAPLSPLGEQQARDAAEHLRGEGIEAVAASDLQRARRTAELIAERLGIDGPVELVKDLRERHVVIFEGRTLVELRAELPHLFDERGRPRVDDVPDAETDDDLCARTVPALRALAARWPGRTVLAVSHGGAIRALERRLGLELGPSTPNLGGRWLVIDADGEQDIRPGAAVVPVVADLATTPKAE